MNDPVTSVATFNSFGYAVSRKGDYTLRRWGEGPLISYNGSIDRLSVLMPFGIDYMFDDAAPDGRPFDEPVTHKFGDGEKTFEFEVTVPEIGGVELSYLRVGFVRDELTPLVEWDPFEILLFGLLTQPADMPRLGTANYAAAVRGNITSPTDRPYRLDSTGAQFVADFGHGTVSATIAARGEQFYDPTKTIDLGSWSGTGSILANTGRFNGPLSGNDGASGEFIGAFFGPGAAEMGMSFYVTQGDYTGVGVVTGLKQSPP